MEKAGYMKNGSKSLKYADSTALYVTDAGGETEPEGFVESKDGGRRHCGASSGDSDCSRPLNGLFASGITREEKKCLVIARNATKRRPLYETLRTKLPCWQAEP
jgi:hypothetical protein